MWTIELADEAHVTEERRIPGVVDRPAVLEPDDEAGRLAHVFGVAVLDDAAAVAGVGHGHAQAGNLLRTALVHRPHVLNALPRQPLA